MSYFQYCRNAIRRQRWSARFFGRIVIGVMCSFEFSEPSENGVGLNKMFDFSEQGLSAHVFDVTAATAILARSASVNVIRLGILSCKISIRIS